MNAAELREKVKSADRKPVPFDVPEWGGLRVYLRPLSLAARLELADLSEADTPTARRIGTFVARCVCDEGGEPLWSPDEAAGLDPDAVTRLYKECRKLNKLGTSADEAAAEKKDSGPTTPDGSPSA